MSNPAAAQDPEPIQSYQEKPSSPNSIDLEKKGRSEEEDVQSATSEGRNESHQGVKRNLKQRHLAMIALGGTIGTGLFVGSGTALSSGGPLGALLGYTIVGTAVYSMMLALGEMGTAFPDSGGFTHFASRFVDPSLGFALGYNYWYCFGIVVPTELTAASLVIQYWNTETNQAAWIAPLFLAIVVVNFCGVQVYGELEFWFSAIKITAIVGLIILGIVINAGGGPLGGGYTGFRYWKSPGPFVQFAAADGTLIEGAWGRFVAFWAVLVQASFSFIGTEILAVTVGEAENPRVAFPKAIKRTFWRILLFYIVSILIIGILVPSNSPRLLSANGNDASASPFVIAIEEAGIKALPSVVNAVLLIAAWSAGNSELYASSRTLYSLSLEGKAPKIFRRTSKSGLPIYCIGLTSLFGFIAFANSASISTGVIFNWLYRIAAFTGLITWECILGSYLRFYYGMRAQNLSRDDLPFRAPFQPYASWFGFLFIFIIILMNGFSVFIGNNFNGSTFASDYIALPIFFCFWISYKLFGGTGERSGPFKIFRITRFVSLEDMDFTFGTREFEEMDAREQLKAAGPKSIGSRILTFLF